MSVNEYGFVCHLTSLMIACDCPMSQMLTPCDQAIIAKLLCPTHDRRWMDRDRSAMHRAFVSNCLHLLSFPLLPPHSPPGHGAPRSVRQLPNIFNLKHCSAHRPASHCRCFIGSTMERAAAIVPSFSITGRPAVAATVIFNGFLRRGEFVSPASSNNRPERLLNSYVSGSFKLIYSL